MDTPSVDGSTPIPAPPGSIKSARILACVLCQHRKIKCDRTFPCANCLKGSNWSVSQANVTCTPSTPAPARKRRRPNQDLQERLARCEELLKAYATAKPDGEAGPSPMGQQYYENDLGRRWQQPGKLIVEDDGGVRFMDSVLLSTVYGELKAMREIVDAEDNEDLSPDTTITQDDNAELILESTSSQPEDHLKSLSMEELQPAPGHIFRLWQIYLERVNPLTKIIHVPTLQPYFVEATSGAHNLPKNIETLLFAIYTLATVSMTPDECLTLLGYSRETALQRFSNGVRLSLIRRGFLKSHDLETLQALTIYLGRYNRHAAWILNGVVLRIAQKMGLHRDGETLGLSPFETEMRRRIWWQIMMVDAKYALLSGLSHSMLPRNWDTKEPKNVNDADLFPSATEPVQDREGPTEMIMVLITNHIARFLAETPGIEPIVFIDTESLCNDERAQERSQEQVDYYRQLISNLGQKLLETIDKYSDPSAGGLHEMVIEIKAEILGKIQSMLLPQRDQVFANEIKEPADNVFRIAVNTIAHDNSHLLRSRDRGFAWFSRLHFQVNIFLFLVGQLCTRTEGALVEKAWENVQSTYDNFPELFDVTQRSYYQVAVYVLKAWRIRETTLRMRVMMQQQQQQTGGGGAGMHIEPPDYVLKLQAALPQDVFRQYSTINNGIKKEVDNAMTPPGSFAAMADVSAGPGPSSSSAMTSENLFGPALGNLSLSEDTSKNMMVLTPAPTNDPVLDHFLSQQYYDPNTIDWDMWSNVMPADTVVSAFERFGTGGNQPPW